MIICCGNLRLVGSDRHRKVSHSRGLGPAARWGGVPKVAPKPSPYMVLRDLVGGPGIPKSCTRTPPWPVGVLVVAPMEWCSKSWGGVPKKLSENPHSGCSKSWGDVPKSCPRIPTLYTIQYNDRSYTI